MRICLRQSFLCLLILFSFSDKSESIFFGFPRRALMNILESLGGQKNVKPIHHYHYYPVPVLLPKPAPPPKIHIDFSSLHSHHHDHTTSYAWPHSNDFAKYHEPEYVAPAPAYTDPAWPSPDPVWAESAQIQSKSYGWDNNELLEKDQTYKESAKSTGILLQVPLHQQIVLYQPPAKNKGSTLLSTFFKKLRRINDALFHPEDDYADQHEHHDSKPHISNTLNYGTP